MSHSFLSWSATHRQNLEKDLLNHFGPTSLMSKACHYPLQTGGKRIRPLLVFAAVEALQKNITNDALYAAMAIELVHTYSLVHDDLPSMDDDDMRRGKPTVHRVFGTPAAILAGDALLTEAFAILAKVSPEKLPTMLETLSQAAGIHGMIAGQSMDIGLEGEITDVQSLTRLHLRKTGALIAASAKLGGIAASATKAQMNALYTYGTSIGLAFQLADDVLDADEDAENNNIPSFVKLLGKEQTQLRSQELLQEAIDCIKMLPHPTPLIQLAKFCVQRDH